MLTTEPNRMGKDVKEELKNLKNHPREMYDNVVRRLIETHEKCLPG
jgi:hypothetical protein